MAHTRDQAAFQSLDQVLTVACREKTVPGIAVLAHSVDGKHHAPVLADPSMPFKLTQALSNTPAHLVNAPSVIRLCLWR